MSTNDTSIAVPPPVFKGLTFSETESAARHSEHWFLTVLPMQSGPSSFHADFCIVPRDPETAPPAGSRIEVKLEAGIGSVHTVETDSRGRARLRDLPFGSYTVRITGGIGRHEAVPPRLGDVPAPLAGERAVPREARETPTLVGSETLALAAKTSGFKPCQTGDRRITAYVTGAPGNQEIHISTSDPEIANARVIFTISTTSFSETLRNGRAVIPLPEASARGFDGWLDDFQVNA